MKRQKRAAMPMLSSGDDDEKHQSHDPIGPPALRKAISIVSPEDPLTDTVERVSRLEMSRDDKAVYLSRAGFLPDSISAILARADRYTEGSEGR